MSTKVILESLRRKLVERKVSYRKLAEGIGVSESTIKRLFTSASDLTLGRLEEICCFLGVSLSELMERNGGPEIPGLKRDQEELLSKNEDLLSLLYGAMTIPNSKRLETFSKRSRQTVQGALRILEKHGLLERDVGDRIRMRVQVGVPWAPRGPLMREVFPKMRREFLDSSFEDSLSEQVFKNMLLTPESAQVIQKKLLAIVSEMIELSKLDLRYSRERVVPWAIYSAMRPYVPAFFGGSDYPSQQALRRYLDREPQSSAV